MRALTGLAVALPLAAFAQGGSGFAAAPANGLTAAQIEQLSKGANQSVIVVLKNQHTELYGMHNKAARAAAIQTDEKPLLSELTQVGAKDVKAYSLVNMISAKVPSAEILHLRTEGNVRAVVPNLKIPRLTFRPSEGSDSSRSGVSSAASTVRSSLSYPASNACTGTPNNPQLNPEALQVTNDAFDNPSTPQAQNLVDGSGVTVAYIADGIDPNQPDFQRTPGTPDYIKDGPHVITSYVDFSGNGLDQPTGGGEAFGDASSIAAQGNTAYDISTSLFPDLAPYQHCWIKIKGMAPGANIMALYANLTFADGVAAIQYAVQNGANVINESFGLNDYPNIETNPWELANDAAVADGVDVVVSSGDTGTQSTLGSPATDPNVIDVGATTTLRLYSQTNYPAFIPGWNLGWEDNQISNFSAAGISYAGNATVDVVAPGDLNWALCSTAAAPNVGHLYTECRGTNGQFVPFEVFGGTSESAPLTAGEVALIIQAYRQTHGGATPTPDVVKEIVKGTATNLDLPSEEQGAGLINALAAVKAAMAYNGPDGAGSPSQSCPGTAGTGLVCSSLIYSTGNAEDALVGKGLPGTPEHLSFQVTNQGKKPAVVHPLLRTLGAPSVQHYTLNYPTCGCVGLVRISNSGSGYTSAPDVTFAAPSNPQGTAAQGTAILDNNGDVVAVQVTDPGSGYSLADNPVGVTFSGGGGSGAAATGQLDNADNSLSFLNNGGGRRIYATQAFTVAAGTSHLSAAVAFPDNYNGDLIRLILIDPKGNMEGWSSPQGGLTQFGLDEVADPIPGTWHAYAYINPHVFVGTVAFDVTQQKFAVTANAVSPSSAGLAPGQTATFQLNTTTPAQAGDQSDDVVLNGSTSGGALNPVIPVVLRSVVPVDPVSGGTFHGILTGGNGRAPGNNGAGQILYYEFNVQPGEQDVDLGFNVGDPGYLLSGVLVSPNGTIDYQSNILTGFTMQFFERNPTPGAWHFILFIDAFSSGNQTSEPFTGHIAFNQAAQNITSNLPDSANTQIPQGTSQQFTLDITNPGNSPESFFADARLVGQQQVLPLAGYVSATPQFSFGYYPAVPAESTQLSVFAESFASPSQPISLDMYDTNGPPFVAGAQISPIVVGSPLIDPNTGNFASVATMTGPEVPPGEWASEVIPTPPYANGFPTADIEQIGFADTQAFDQNSSVSTGNFWLAGNHVNGAAPYTPLNLDPGGNGSITVTLSPPSGTAGQVVQGVVYVETMTSLGTPVELNQVTGSPDELIAIPYEYIVGQ